MAGEEGKRRSWLKEHAKELRARFSDYQNAVTLISSVESWFQHLWGSEGENPGLLQSFDRFPELDGTTPDFLARFSTPYLLCGEHVKNFRAEPLWGRKDAHQVLKYAMWQPTPVGGSIPGYDVMLLVGTHSDDSAAQQLQLAAGEGPRAPIVIVGFYRDPERINGEWYNLKWRPHDGKNSRFSRPNVNKDPNGQDLNKLIVEQQDCPIRVDESALDITERIPLINDEPPDIYTFIRIVWPGINELLSEQERDDLHVKGRVEKRVTCEQILGASILKAVKAPRGYVHKALDWLSSIGRAKRLTGQEEGTYVLFLDQQLIRKELPEFLGERAARAALPRRRGRPGSRRRATKDAPGQGRLNF